MIKHFLAILKDQRGTFVIDSFLLLPFCGKVIAILSKYFSDIENKKRFIRWTAVFVLGLFWAVAGGLYFDCLSPWPISSLSGNDFMWNWGALTLFGVRLVPLESIPTYVSIHSSLNLIAGIFFFVVYPFMLWFEIQVGFGLFGRSSRQKGLIDLLKRREKNSPFN